MTQDHEDPEPEMYFSKARMAVLRVVYFLVGIAVLFLAKVEFEISDSLFMLLALMLLAVIIISYPLQLKLVYSVAYKKRELGPDAMIGLEGYAMENLTPSGKVKVRGEIWTATAESGAIAKGQEVVVLSPGDNLTLLVKPKRAQETPPT
jgi:membrane-bound ClpP family serine protease